MTRRMGSVCDACDALASETLAGAFAAAVAERVAREWRVARAVCACALRESERRKMRRSLTFIVGLRKKVVCLKPVCRGLRCGRKDVRRLPEVSGASAERSA